MITKSKGKKSLDKQGFGPFDKLDILLTVDQYWPVQVIVMLYFSHLLIELNHLPQQLTASHVLSGVDLLELLGHVLAVYEWVYVGVSVKLGENGLKVFCGHSEPLVFFQDLDGLGKEVGQ